MLQAALLLLACGLCRHIWSINASVALTLISLTGLGVVFYVTIVIAGVSSYGCPFQTPASIALHGPWKRVRRRIVSSIVHSKRVLIGTRQTWKRRVRLLLCRQSLPTTTSLESIQVHESEPWLKPKDLAIIRRMNSDDVGCVSWILRNITDPEAIDAAIRLAGEIRWFDDGINVDPPYDLIVSTFKACFDPTGKLYPGSRDRAYHSGRAMIWIRTLAICNSEDLLRVNSAARYPWSQIDQLLDINPGHTPSHSQWVSNVLLHVSCANRFALRYGLHLYHVSRSHETKISLPSGVTLNRLLLWCIFFGSPVEKEALKIQDKSYDIPCFDPSHC